jgi:O-antigen/teichoic acid export membrane protein
MSFLTEAFRDTSKYFLFRGFSVIIGIITLPILARLLDPDNFGVYSVIITTISLLVLFFSGWSKEAIVRLFHEYKEENKQHILFTNGLFSSSLTGSCIIICVYIFNLFLDFINPTLLIICSGIVFLKTLTFVCIGYVRANQEVTRTGFSQLFQKFSEVYIGIPLLWIGFTNNLLAILIGWFIGELLLFFYFFSVLKIKIISEFKFLEKDIISNMIAYGLPLIISGVAALLLQYSDRYIIMYYRGEIETGIYAFSYQIADRTIGFLPELLSLGVWPIIVKYSTTDFEYTKQKISMFFRIYTTLLFPVIIVVCYFPKELILLFGTEQYLSDFPVIPLVIIGVFLNSLAWYPKMILLLRKKTNIIMIAILLATIINVSFNIFFIPRFGYAFAAISTLISYFIILGLIFASATKYHLNFLKDINYLVKLTFISVIILLFQYLFLVKIDVSQYGSLIKLISWIPYIVVYFLVVYLLFYRGFVVKLKNGVSKILKNKV